MTRSNTSKLSYEEQRERAYAWAGRLDKYLALKSKESEPTPGPEEQKPPSKK